VLFNYCPLQYLDPEYRKQLVVAELEHYNADVVCLQEVDEKAFTEFFLPHMQLRGNLHILPS
jgi:mRNA deadenylase 3'-5' endonuclease subunit Ccr4